MKATIEAYRFADERTIGWYASRERLGGRLGWSVGLNLWIGCVYATVRP